MYNLIIHLESAIFAGLGKDIEAIKGLGKYLDSLGDIVGIISKVIGLDVLLLFIAVALISSLLSFIGVPKGRFSFLLSLLIADLFWVTWIRSIYTTGDAFIKYIQVIKCNIILIIPFVIIHLIKKPGFLKKSGKKIINLLKSFSKKETKEKTYGKSEIIDINNNIQKSIQLFNQSMLKDILNRKDKDEFIFSSDTLKYKTYLEKLLKGLDQNRKNNDDPGKNKSVS